MNLLAKDIFEGTILTQVTNAARWFRENHAPNALLRTKEINMPPMPCDVRWGTQHDLLCWYNSNWAALLEIGARLLRPNDPLRISMENIQVRQAFGMPTPL